MFFEKLKPPPPCDFGSPIAASKPCFMFFLVRVKVWDLEEVEKVIDVKHLIIKRTKNLISISFLIQSCQLVKNKKKKLK